MKKYFRIFEATLNDKLQYLGELLSKFFGFTLMVFIFVNLWKHIYEDPNEIINGYTFNMMLWYVLIGEAYYTVMKNRDLTRGIKEDIVFGNIAYKINKPYFYPFYCVAQYFGNIMLKVITSVFVATTLGLLLIGKLETFSLKTIPLVFIVIVFAFLINIFLRIAISVSSFYIEDPEPFLWVLDKFLLVFGTVFPIEMYSNTIQTIIKFTPIYTIVYGPTKLLVDFDFEIFKSVLVAQIIQLAVIVIICCFVYRKGEKKVNVNGG